MTGIGALSFASPAWALPAAAALVAAVLALAWGYRRGGPGGRAQGAALALKLAGLLLVAVCLAEPSWTTDRARPGANAFAVLADNGRGLRVADRGARGSRGEALRAALGAPGAEAPWLARLAETFQVRRYLFDARLRRTADFSELAFDGPASDLAAGLRGIADRFRGGPLAGILVFTDGVATDLDLGRAPFDAAGLPPIYPVVVGGDAPDADVALGAVTVTQTAFEDAPVSIEAQIDAAGQRGRTLTAQLVDEAGAVVQTQALAVGQEDEALVARFRLRPARAGVSFYRVKVEGGREATTANNARLVVVDRPAGPHRVLYVGGRPSWDFKFLRRAVADDAEVELAALVRVALREPKFVFHRKGDAANPLFRGFGADEEEADRYDQPVLVRLGTRDASELGGGFPKAAEELFGFHAVVIDDLEAGFFSADQQELVRRFVTERGGGLLMLGGQGSFAQGGYARSPIGEVLPVYLDRGDGTPVPPATLELTREGWLEPWARLRAGEGDERARLAAMPPFRVISRVRGAKPGATALLTAAAGEGPRLPALVVHRAGAGRAAALATGDLWRWAIKDPAHGPDLAKFWRQTVRWLVADVPAPVSLRVERQARGEGAGGQSVALRVRVHDRAFRPADDAAVRLEVTAPDGRKSALVAEAAAEPGLYEASFAAARAGGHRVRAVATGPDGAAIGEAESGWAVDLEADEHRSLRANRGLLEAIARATGGRVLAVGDLDRFVRDLPTHKAPVLETDTRPLWHSWLVLAVAIGCFAGEWAIRRRRGLP